MLQVERLAFNSRRIHVCVYELHTCMSVRAAYMYGCVSYIHVCVYVCIHVCVYELHTCMCVRATYMYVCIHVCMCELTMYEATVLLALLYGAENGLQRLTTYTALTPFIWLASVRH